MFYIKKCFNCDLTEKVLFHILQFYRDSLDFSYFYNLNYRGVAVLQIKQKFKIPESDIVSINAYNYTTDFNTYMDLMKTLNSKV